MRVIAQAPTRISLFGGSTDTPFYADKFGGFCINLAINIRQHVELSDEGSPKKLEIEDYDNLEFFNIFLLGEHVRNLKHTFDNTIESGLGSSAALGVALVGASAKLNGRNLTLSEIAEEAWNIEVNKLHLFGGKQDQYAASFGGVNAIEFGNKVSVTPLSKSFIDPLLPSLCLFYLGKNRTSNKIQEGLKNPNAEQIRALHSIKKIALEAIQPIGMGDIERVGYLMTKSWEMKKRSNKVTTDFIDEIYRKGIESGALGGKVCGSGQGGHFLFIIKPEERKKFIKDMEITGIKNIDFSISWDGLDCRVL